MENQNMRWKSSELLLLVAILTAGFEVDSVFPRLSATVADRWSPFGIQTPRKYPEWKQKPEKSRLDNLTVLVFITSIFEITGDVGLHCHAIKK